MLIKKMYLVVNKLLLKLKKFTQKKKKKMNIK